MAYLLDTLRLHQFYLAQLFLSYFSYLFYLKNLKATKKKIVELETKQIIVALDFDNLKEAEKILNQLNPSLYRVKVGSQLFNSEGPDVI